MPAPATRNPPSRRRTSDRRRLRPVRLRADSNPECDEHGNGPHRHGEAHLQRERPPRLTSRRTATSCPPTAPLARSRGRGSPSPSARKFTYELSGSFWGGYFTNKSKAAQFAATPLDYETWYASPSIRYEFNRDMYLEGSYTFTKVDNNAARLPRQAENLSCSASLCSMRLWNRSMRGRRAL